MGTGSPRKGTGATVLAIGDVHLGTRPVSLPTDLAVDPRALTPAAGLEIAVDCAIEARVDAVVFAGDVVESTNARFEAMAPLERAVRRLSKAQIPIFAVAGNHDVEALPRLAARLDGFTLLGAGGKWSSAVVLRDGQPVLEVLGWSFPERHVGTSPVAALLRTPLVSKRAGLPRLGVLHGDLDASKGRYAPFSSREIEQVGLDAWVFGHIHRPSLSASQPATSQPATSQPATRHTSAGTRHSSAGTQARARGTTLSGYLGSLVGLDSGETGPHGPWLIRMAGDRQIGAEQLVIAPLRWERLRVAVGKNEEAEDLADRLADEVEALAHRLEHPGPAPRALGVQIIVAGPTRHYQAIRQRIEDGTWTAIRRQVGATAVFVHRVIDDLRLAVDLEEIARGEDPPGLLARRLLALRGGGGPARELLAAARAALRPLASDPLWRLLENGREARDPLSDEALRGVLEQAATAALDALLAGRQQPAEGSS